MTTDTSTERQGFRIAFTGDAVQEGLMRAHDLAPVLLAVNELCERANELLNQDKAAVHVRVSRRFVASSFEIFFELWQSLPDDSKALFADYAVTRSRELLEILGLVGATASDDPRTIQSVIELLKWQKGKRPKSVEVIPQDTSRSQALIVENVEGEKVTVNQNIFNVAGDVHIHDSFEDVFQPLEQSGVEALEVREEEKVVTSITRNEVPYFRLPDEPEEVLHEYEREVVAELISPHFREGLKWRFSTGKGERFTAEMHDTDFLAKLDRREQTFGKGDIVRMKIKSITSQTPSGIKSEHQILQVITINPPPFQITLRS